MEKPNLADRIDDFFSDLKVERLLDLARETRPLQICYPNEVPITRFLAWALDPSQGHGLQDKVIRKMLMTAWQNRGDAEVEKELVRKISPAAWPARPGE